MNLKIFTCKLHVVCITTTKTKNPVKLILFHIISRIIKIKLILLFRSPVVFSFKNKPVFLLFHTCVHYIIVYIYNHNTFANSAQCKKKMHLTFNYSLVFEYIKMNTIHMIVLFKNMIVARRRLLALRLL